MPTVRPPSIDAVIKAANGALAGRDHAAVVAEARRVVAEERERLADGGQATPVELLAVRLSERLRILGGAAPAAPGVGLRGAINATGVLLHTNLGRAAWSTQAIEAAVAAAARPSLLELDEATGRRGRRFRAVEDEVVALTGAEDALVTNNNAAAVALAVGLAGRGGVAVSRGELVEIGGGGRVPEVIRRAGARLVEVGTTNRTRAADFEEVLADGRARLVLRVHPSNFAQTGFVESPDPKEVAEVAHRHGALLVDDLGSGALLDTARFGLAHEPMPGERLADGADIVTFSGDKLVGGPQAGIIAGRADLVARLRKDPLARAMRPDKVILAALAATLRLYRGGVALTEIPVWRQVATQPEELHERASAIVTWVTDRQAGHGRTELIPVLSVERTESTVGGGSLPGETLLSWAVVIAGVRAERLVAGLRSGVPAVIGRIRDDAVVLDVRTVEPSDDDRLAGAILAAIS